MWFRSRLMWFRSRLMPFSIASDVPDVIDLSYRDSAGLAKAGYASFQNRDPRWNQIKKRIALNVSCRDDGERFSSQERNGRKPSQADVVLLVDISHDLERAMTRFALFPAHGINPGCQRALQTSGTHAERRVSAFRQTRCLHRSTEALLFQTLCGAPSKSTGQSCRHIAGEDTDHVGQGRCRHHGDATPMDHGLYSTIRRSRLQEHAACSPPMDGSPMYVASPVVGIHP